MWQGWPWSWKPTSEIWKECIGYETKTKIPSIESMQGLSTDNLWIGLGQKAVLDEKVVLGEKATSLVDLRFVGETVFQKMIHISVASVEMTRTYYLCIAI